MKYKRVLLKLSGESLMGEKEFGIDHDKLQQYSEDIKSVVDKGVEVAVVIGGGNIFRGVGSDEMRDLIDRVQGDYMGMLATMINASSRAPMGMRSASCAEPGNPGCPSTDLIVGESGFVSAAGCMTVPFML